MLEAVILSNLRSALNVGAIFRAADALGLKKIYLCGTTPCPGQTGRAGRDLAKTALGAERNVAWEYSRHTKTVFKKLKSDGFKLVALEQADQAVNLLRFRQPRKYVLILGSETKGVARSILSECDKIIYIPMFGQKESLNVSVAFGVAGYGLKFFKHG